MWTVETAGRVSTVQAGPVVRPERSMMFSTFHGTHSDRISRNQQLTEPLEVAQRCIQLPSAQKAASLDHLFLHDEFAGRRRRRHCTARTRGVPCLVPGLVSRTRKDRHVSPTHVARAHNGHSHLRLRGAREIIVLREHRCHGDSPCTSPAILATSHVGEPRRCALSSLRFLPAPSRGAVRTLSLERIKASIAFCVRRALCATMAPFGGNGGGVSSAYLRRGLRSVLPLPLRHSRSWAYRARRTRAIGREQGCGRQYYPTCEVYENM
ncbi:hypothetical protein C8Q80DRAFT_71099 [Daedaleopsis nitida]|nr:hypothetical protein C8Q80DRAFT_71099 [Daedaleopsis nitida]